MVYVSDKCSLLNCMYAKKQREGSGGRSPLASKASCKDKEGNAIKDMWN